MADQTAIYIDRHGTVAITPEMECIRLGDGESLAEVRAAIGTRMVTYDDPRRPEALEWSSGAERHAARLPRMDVVA